MEPASALIIDDDPSFQFILERLIRKFGAVCTVVTTADDALAALENQPFDLVLCDLQLPGGGGPELLKELQRLTPFHARNVVVVTGFPFVASSFASAFPVIDKRDLHDLTPHLERIFNSVPSTAE